ncbi:MAG: hypothetical protein H7250_00295 [Flavobacterium sp.]|nr:hypothetical protein [Flavobacterium sp.]
MITTNSLSVYLFENDKGSFAFALSNIQSFKIVSPKKRKTRLDGFCYYSKTYDFKFDISDA